MPDVTSPIVINIPGAKLLSSRGSGSNGRQHRHAKSRDVAEQRAGADAHAVAALCKVPEYQAEIARWTGGAKPTLSSRPILVAKIHGAGRTTLVDTLFPAKRVTLTRLCPKRYFCDGADNLRALFKATLDGVSDALGVNDKVFVDNPTDEQIQAGAIAIRYDQIVGPWGIRITIEA